LDFLADGIAFFAFSVDEIVVEWEVHLHAAEGFPVIGKVNQRLLEVLLAGGWICIQTSDKSNHKTDDGIESE
jgi:hypothetical protein